MNPGVGERGEREVDEAVLARERRECRLARGHEWIETGAQARAAIKLIERAGGAVAGIGTINADSTAASDFIGRGYPVFAATKKW